MSEFEFITRITGRLTHAGAGRPAGSRTGDRNSVENLVEIGPGDDAAVLRVPDGRVVATCALLVEGRHFRRDWSGPYDVGRKAAAQNLADVVAMGARPTALLVGFGVSPEIDVTWAERLYDGLRDECDLVGAMVAGGDVVRSGEVILAVTALGDLAGRAPLLRAGARPGDAVAVRGRLGFAAAGLDLLTRGLDGPADLIEAHRRPRPPYEAGEEAVRHGATALMDVSDGLVQDLGHLAAASGIQIDVDSAALPIPAELGAEGRRFVLTGGEDHAFAATFPSGKALPAGWRTIGRVTAGKGVTVDGRPHEFTGWDHFLD